MLSLRGAEAAEHVAGIAAVENAAGIAAAEVDLAGRSEAAVAGAAVDAEGTATPRPTATQAALRTAALPSAAALPTALKAAARSGVLVMMTMTSRRPSSIRRPEPTYGSIPLRGDVSNWSSQGSTPRPCSRRSAAGRRLTAPPRARRAATRRAPAATSCRASQHTSWSPAWTHHSRLLNGISHVPADPDMSRFSSRLATR